MNNRTISKGFFLVAMLSAILMAVFGWEHSYSQNALKQYGWLLGLYLGCGSLGFGFLTADALNRNDKFTFIKWKIQWGYLYLWMTISFLLVSVFNVYQKYWLHIIATGFVVLGAYVLCWNYFITKWKRYCAIGAISISVVYFLTTWIFKLHTIAWGEMVITTVALCVSWIIINEKLNK